MIYWCSKQMFKIPTRELELTIDVAASFKLCNACRRKTADRKSCRTQLCTPLHKALPRWLCYHLTLSPTIVCRINRCLIYDCTIKQRRFSTQVWSPLHLLMSIKPLSYLRTIKQRWYSMQVWPGNRSKDLSTNFELGLPTFGV